MKRRTKLVTAVGMAGLVAAAVQLQSSEVTAADHADGPTAAADPAADIADFFAWHDDGGRLYAAVTFAGLAEAGAAATYDPDVLYTIHIDDDGDGTSDHQIYVRFGQNDLEEWGIRVDGLPGEDGPFETAVETVGAAPNGGQAIAGSFDDPFFFDLDGFGTTLANIAANPMGYGNLAISAKNDTFAGFNVTAIVLDMDAAAADADADSLIQMWATTGRLTPR